MFTINSILNSTRPPPPSPPSPVKEWVSTEERPASGVPSTSPFSSSAVPPTSSSSSSSSCSSASSSTSSSSSSSCSAAVSALPLPPTLVPATPLLSCVAPMSPVSPCLSLTPSLLSSVSQLLDFSALVPSTSSFASAIDTVPSSASSFHSSASAFVPISVTPATALPAGAVSSHSTAQSPLSEGKTTTTTTSPHQRLVLPVVASVPSAPLASSAPSDLSRSQTPFAASVTASPHAVHTAFTSPACAIHTAYTAHLPSHSTLNSGYASHTPSVAQSSFPYAPLGPVPSPAFAKVPPVLAFPPTPSARTFLLPAPSVAPPKAEPPADDEGGAGRRDFAPPLHPPPLSPLPPVHRRPPAPPLPRLPPLHPPPQRPLPSPSLPPLPPSFLHLQHHNQDSPLEGDFHARVLIARPSPRPQGVAEVFESKEVESAFPLHEARRCEVEEHFVRSFHPHYFPPGFLPSSYPLSLQAVSVYPALGVKSRRRGGQARYTTTQTKQLEKWFSEHRYITPQTRKVIAGELDLKERQVKTWFQNRRAKEKRRRGTTKKKDTEDKEKEGNKEEEKRTEEVKEDLIKDGENN